MTVREERRDRDAVRRPFGRLRDRRARRPAGRLPAAPRPRPPPAAHRAQLPRQPLRLQGAGGRGARLGLRRRLDEARVQADRHRRPRPVLRPHPAPGRHLLRQRPGRPRLAGQAGLPAPGRRSSPTSARAAGATVHEGGTYVCMEGPQFSTRAESEVYRSHGVGHHRHDQPARRRELAREAEICYVSLSMVTDYDCWHETEEAVSGESVMEVIEPERPRCRRRWCARCWRGSARRHARDCLCAEALASTR